MELYQKTKKIIDEGSLSKSEYDSTNSPFMQQNNHSTEIKYNSISDERLINFPVLLAAIYKTIGDDSVEFNYGNWTFLGLKNIEKRTQIYQKDDQHKLVDIGIKYHGMGFCYVCSINIDSKMICFRIDGGSNDWDRENNYKIFTKMVPDINKEINFDTFISKINNFQSSDDFVLLNN